MSFTTEETKFSGQLKVLKDKHATIQKRILDIDQNFQNGEIELLKTECERDKLINQYEKEINLLSGEIELARHSGGMIKKLENEKKFLESEIQKVRAVKVLLENELNCFNEEAEIRRLKNEAAKCSEEIKKLKSTIYIASEQTGDLDRMDVEKALTKFKTESDMVLFDQEKMIDEISNLNIKLTELEEEKVQYKTNKPAMIRDLKKQKEMLTVEVENVTTNIGGVSASRNPNFTYDDNRAKILAEENLVFRQKVEFIEKKRRTAAKNSESEIEFLENQLRALREKDGKTDPKALKIVAKIDEAQAERLELERENADLEQEYYEVFEKIKARGLGNHSKLGELSRLKGELNSYESQNKVLENKLTAVENDTSTTVIKKNNTVYKTS